MKSSEIKKKIITFQQQLNVVADGQFGPKSETALQCSKYRLKLLPTFKRHLPVHPKATDETINKVVETLAEEIYNPVYMAYILATIYHETAGTFLPIEEYGKGKTKKYGRVYDIGTEQYGYCNGQDNRTYKISDYPNLYYGRGYVQLTWFDNYKKFGDLLNIDLLGYPKKACEPDIAAKITILGMTKGLFTGYSLSRAFKNHGLVDADWLNARKIINGTDKDAKIAAEAKIFLEHLYLDSMI